MNDIDALLKLIQLSIIKGHSQAQAFEEVHSQFGFPNNSPNLHKIREFFQHVARNELHRVPHEFHTALILISRAYAKVHHSIEARECPFPDLHGCRMVVLSERYALDMNNVKGQRLCLIDMLHQQKRALQIENDSLDHRYLNSRLVAIDSRHFFVFNSRATEQESHSTAQLVELSLEEMKFRVLDQKTIKGYYFRMVFDQMDRNKFFVYTDDTRDQANNISLLIRGRIKNGKLEFQEPMNFDFSLFDQNFRLIGDKFIGIKREGETAKTTFVEMTFDGPGGRIMTKDLFNIEDVVGLRDVFEYQSEHSIWFHNTLYMLKNTNTSYHGSYVFFSFDLDIQKTTIIRRFEIDSIANVRIVDGILVICTLNRMSKQHRFLRIPLTTPEKLGNLAMRAIQEKLMLASETEYRTFVGRLPPNLRPFFWVDQ